MKYYLIQRRYSEACKPSTYLIKSRPNRPLFSFQPGGDWARIYDDLETLIGDPAFYVILVTAEEASVFKENLK